MEFHTSLLYIGMEAKERLNLWEQRAYVSSASNGMATQLGLPVDGDFFLLFAGAVQDMSGSSML